MFLRKLVHASRESIYVNSTYLLLSSTALSALGFVFWTICTHIYSTTEVGIATALLAGLNLITSLSLLGFEISIIRVLPKHADKNKIVNTTLSIAGALGLIFAGLFIFLQPHIAGSLGVIRTHAWYSVLFVFYTLFSVASYILESVFVAYRQAKFVFRKNVIFSFAKIILAVSLTSAGAFGIYSAWMIGLGLAVLYSLVVLVRQFNHKFKLSLKTQPLKGMMRYSTGNYLASFVEGLPVMLLPLIVTTAFGPVENAYYYMAMTFAGFIFTVAIAATQSLFAEGSHSQLDMRNKTIKTLKYVSLFMLPSIIGILLLGPFLLLIFGREYATHASELLDILAVSAVPVALNTIARTVLQINYRVRELVAIDIIGTLPIFGLLPLLKSTGINSVGIAWLIGQSLMLVLFAYVFVRRRSLLSPA